MGHKPPFHAKEARHSFPSCQHSTLSAGPRNELIGCCSSNHRLTNPYSLPSLILDITMMQMTRGISRPAHYFDHVQFSGPKYRQALLPHPSGSSFASTFFIPDDRVPVPWLLYRRLLSRLKLLCFRKSTWCAPARMLSHFPFLCCCVISFHVIEKVNCSSEIIGPFSY